jgi:hypothetical protein
LFDALEPHDHAWLHQSDARWLRAAVDALDRGIEMRYRSLA